VTISARPHTVRIGVALAAVVGVLASCTTSETPAGDATTTSVAKSTTTTATETTTTAPEATTTTLPPARDNRFETLAGFDLPGVPMGIAVDPERDLAYLSLGEGTIVRFAPSSLIVGDAPDFEVVADGLESPRGIEIAGDRLIVAELGHLLCDPQFPHCHGTDIPGVDTSKPAAVRKAEAEILRESSGRVVSYAIDETGDLSDRTVVLDGLPVVNTTHGINGITLGPDGHLYVSIGNVGDVNLYHADTLTHPRQDLMGTIVEFLPDGSDVSTFATGLRNVYDVAFDPAGEMWGVDNDGPTPTGWREEELLQIKRGAEYGFPYEGSFTHVIRTDGALEALLANGSAGIAWVDDPSIGSGILTGSCGRVIFVAMEETDDGTWRIVDNDADRYTRVVLTPPGCVNGIAAIGDRFLLIDFAYGGPGRLFVLGAAEK